MIEELKKQLSSAQLLIVLLILTVGTYLFQTFWQVLALFSDVFIILLSAWLVSFILEPLVERLARMTRLNLGLSASIVYILALGLIGSGMFVFFPTVVNQMQQLGQLLPSYASSYPDVVNRWGDVISSGLSSSVLLLPSVANFFFYVFITLIISFYFVVDKHTINTAFYHLIPSRWHSEAKFIQHTIDMTFSSFLRVTLLFALFSGIATWIVLMAFGSSYAASTALIAGILTMVPLIGPALALIPAALTVFITSPDRFFLVMIVLIIVQQVIFNVIGPKLIGNVFRMHPVIVILSFIIGYRIAGGAGAIFAIPVLGILFILFHRLWAHFVNPTKE
jgi:predicted PurR-regulated permease PerM